MAVGYRSSSANSTSDQFTSSCAVPVPSGAAAGDIAILLLEHWESTNPTVTYPSGFTEFINFASGNQKIKAAWKRLTAGDTGNYTMSWTGSQWNMGHCVLITGGLSSGDPIEATHTASATSTNTPSTSVTVATNAFLLHAVANESAATSTPPTDFTEVQDGNYLHTNYRIPGTTGIFTASGGTHSVSSLQLAILIAVMPEAVGPPPPAPNLYVVQSNLRLG